MLAYASRTGTRRNLDGLRAAGWRLIVSATGVLRSEGFPYALDNGAWTAHQKGEPFDGDAFRRALDLMGPAADFVVLPDVVAGGPRSLDLSLSWLREVTACGAPVYLPVQNGICPSDLVGGFGIVDQVQGLFVGGDTPWKLRTMPQWGEVARAHRLKLHVGRVNTRRRIIACQLAGADSFDGSRPSKWSKGLGLLQGTRRQRLLDLGAL